MPNVKTKLIESLGGKRGSYADLLAFCTELVQSGQANDAETLADILLNFQFYIEQRSINAHLLALQQAARNIRSNDYQNKL